MRSVVAALLLLSALALAAPDFVVDFLEPQLSDTDTPNNDTLADDRSLLELVRRQGPNACASGYAACVNLNAPNLCCPRTQICSADANRNVACCPQGAACTGTISPVFPGQTASPTSTSGVVIGTTTTAFTGPTQTDFIQTSGSSARSTVPNTFFPFFVIPTTYPNAAACSDAYTSCSNHARDCVTALATGLPGVTVSGPNGGATITAVPSIGQQSAESVCASLSATACSGLVVEACGRFGSDSWAERRCRGGMAYTAAAAGVAIGFARQLF